MLGLVIAFFLGGVSAGVSGSDDTDLRAFELEVEAARSEHFYLVVDVPAATLAFRLGGVTLQSYALTSISSGKRLFAPAPADVLLRLSECRPRVTRELSVIRPGSPIIDEAPDVERHERRLDLDCGADLSVLLTDGTRAWRDGIRASGEPDASMRVRAVLSEEDVGKLSAVLPESFLLLFVLR